jgi:hypothetical protein
LHDNSNKTRGVHLWTSVFGIWLMLWFLFSKCYRAVLKRTPPHD